MQKIKKGDKVKVLTGSDRGKTGEVMKVLPTENKVVISGVNEKTIFSKKSVNAGKKLEFPIHISNVALIDEKGNCGRVGFKFDENGNKTRFIKEKKRNV